ncbi:MAG TPA: acyltransferase [Polyangiaceae bacterium]|jgi:hypothetical protein|nr:acyltransferase [Polyangiaceae bacterium]
MSRNKLGSIVPALLLLSAPLVTGCKKEEPPPPLPTAAPVATQAPAPLQLKPIDAGLPPAPSASAAPVAHGTGSGGGGLSKCCTALTQNAASAPEPTKTYMLQAAAVCKAAVAGGNTAGIAGTLGAMLRGAGMPSSCQ